MTIQEALQNLEKLECNESNLEIIVESIQTLDKYLVVRTTLHKGKRIIRVRNSEPTSFSHVNALGAKPAELNSTFQRASIPHTTMFYGAVVPEVQNDNEPQSARITTAFEVNYNLTDKNFKGEIDMTYSVWEVQEDIELISIIHHTKFTRPPKIIVALQARYEEELKKLDPSIADISKIITDLFSNEFAKYPINNHIDYMKSALFANHASKYFDGVLYPSVRLFGEGINVAINPDVANSRLLCLQAAECTWYKNEMNTFLGNNKESNILPSGELEFRKVANNIYVPREIGRKQVGLEN